MKLSDNPAPGVSAPDDVDEQLVLGDMADEDIFEIPLKPGHSRSNNFSELSEEIDSVSDGGSSGDVEKRVRFEPGEEEPVGVEHQHPRSRRKKNVEDLLQYANQVNDYVAQNLENINNFRSELLNSDYPSKPRSDIATQATPFSASMSNFELSDDEYDEQEATNSESTCGQICKGDLNILDRSDDSLLRTVSRSFSSPDPGTNIDSANIDHTLENSPQPSDTDVLNSPELIQHLQSLGLRPSRETSTTLNVKDADRSLVLDRGSLEDHEIPDLPPEQSIEILQDTVDLILKLSASSDALPDTTEDSAISASEFASFNMKSTPTVTYKEFISRIQSKCMFGTVVYLAAAFLIQTLFLTRDQPGGALLLRLRLDQCHIHRLVVATIRVATKLLEDFVHSHQYFCKVCGVSKRLLTKLEVALIICLKHDGLIITSAKLAATRQIRDELMRNETN